MKVWVAEWMDFYLGYYLSWNTILQNNVFVMIFDNHVEICNVLTAGAVQRMSLKGCNTYMTSRVKKLTKCSCLNMTRLATRTRPGQDLA